VRLERGQSNAAELARRLSGHPAVARVRYPGLPEDPGHQEHLPPGLVRLSVGCEHVEDLWDDLAAGLGPAR
jgi:cystathionine beta-lyase/cystathionine gamma-synthase